MANPIRKAAAVGSLVELARVAKADGYAGYGEPRKRIPGSGALTAAGAGSAGVAGLMALSTRRMSERSQADAQRAKRAANEANRVMLSNPGNKVAESAALKASRKADVADLVAENAPKRAKFIRRKAGKAALVGAALGGAGYGIKRLNDEA